MNAWIDVNIRLPEKYKDVLIKMGDGSQRVGRLNRLNAWEMASYQHCKHQYMANPVFWFDENFYQPNLVSVDSDGSKFDEHFRTRIDYYADRHPSLLVRQLARRLRTEWTPEKPETNQQNSEHLVRQSRGWLLDRIRDLEDAITSLQEKQTKEPWGWALIDKNGTAQSILPRRAEFFGAVQERESFTSEDLAKMDREWAGLAPHSVVTLFANESSASFDTKKGQS